MKFPEASKAIIPYVYDTAMFPEVRTFNPMLTFAETGTLLGTLGRQKVDFEKV